MVRALALGGLVVCGTAFASDYDPDPAWPLCGRIAEAPPEGWDGLSCPPERWGDPGEHDFPLSDTFGPRTHASDGGRYDFHRGIDMPTPAGTPVFAVADGQVKIAGDHGAYANPLVQIRHWRPGEPSCRPTGCWYSLSMHLSGWSVAGGDRVEKGDLIGYTGASDSGWEHLHFEIRDSPPEDVWSRWQRDAIHPLGVLPYPAAAPEVAIRSTLDPADPQPLVEVWAAAARADVVAVEVVLRDASGAAIPQPGAVQDAGGYLVHPPSWDVDRWNFDYTHKDSSSVPWEGFGEGGEWACPHRGQHGSSYQAAVHLDRATFNGVGIDPQPYRLGTEAAAATWTFYALSGPAACVQAVVTTADGATATARQGDCP